MRKLLQLPLDQPLPLLDVRMGTTRGTNALLTRRGAKTALITTTGFADCLLIGEQDRPELFALTICKREPLTNICIEVTERLAADGQVLQSLDINAARAQFLSLRDQGIESLAISLLHAWKNPQHELALKQVAEELGFEEISLSSKLAPVIRFVPRTETTVLDAYLNPVLSGYLSDIWQQFGGSINCQFQTMTSGGTLVPSTAMRGKDSVLSGPAGGVVALAAVLASHGIKQAIGLDMGGTSTDVSRIDGQPIKQFEAIKAGVRVLTPSMAIHTVAAGGGSICHFDGERLRVGPDSASADPGPACYGRGGPLAVTDLNLALGRLVTKQFPFKLDHDATIRRLEALRLEMHQAGLSLMSVESLAEGFWQIANHSMAEAVRTMSIAEGVDPRPLVLVGFGGAAGQHLCAIADVLGITHVLDHPESGVLSALGMGLAVTGRAAVKGFYQPLTDVSSGKLLSTCNQLVSDNCESLQANSVDLANIRNDATVELRYLGTDTPIELPLGTARHAELIDLLAKAYRQRFGYDRDDTVVELVNLRVTSTVPAAWQLPPITASNAVPMESPTHQRLFRQGSWLPAGVFDRQQLPCGAMISGPAIIAGPWNTLVVDPDWQATIRTPHERRP